MGINTLSLPLLVACWAISGGSADLSVNARLDGTYDVTVNGAPWLRSAATRLQANGMHHTTDDGTLKLDGPPVTYSSKDRLGASSVVTYRYRASSQAGMHASIRSYKDVPAVVFSQSFDQQLSNTSVGDKSSIVSSFPSFKVDNPPTEDELGYLAFGDLMIGWVRLKMGKWQSDMDRLPDGLLSGPLAVFDRKGNVVIISAFSQFMVNSYLHLNGSLGYGVMGDVDTIPAGYRIETVMFYSSGGINQALEDWGRVMRYYYKRNQAARENDISVKYIGYYTDNGAYYYHATEPNMNYEETILKAYDYSKSIGVPYRYIQYDDWFYPIEGPGYGATVTWDAMPSVFPHGLQYLYNYTGLPVVAHNRYWSHKTTYATKNGGKFNFIIDEKAGEAIPDDQSFWDYLFSWAKTWGLVVYEQDWLNHQMEVQSALYGNVDMGSRWLKQMGEAASRYGLQLQYCMCLPRELMQALEIPAVSHARASDDYVSEVQWKIGVTSMFADAMGVAPFKDNLWTMGDQPGNRYKRNESNVMREATVALLSTGPVGPSDRIGYSNSTLIMRLVTADGLLLKPSKPATAIDQQIIDAALGGDLTGELWSTYSEISGLRFGIVFASEMTKPYSLRPWQLHWNRDVQDDQYIFPLDMPLSGKPALFSEEAPLQLSNSECGSSQMCLHFITPRLYFDEQPVLILGELAKLVPMSPQRVSAIVRSPGDLRITLSGTPGEKVNFTVLNQDEPWRFDCKIGGLGSAVISMRERTCF